MPRSKTIDPSEFRHRVGFFAETSVADGYAGHKLGRQELLTTWAAKQEPSQTLSYNDLLALQAGAQVMKADVVLTIRYRPDFLPDKAMQFKLDDQFYIITSVQELDEPTRYVRIVGKRAA